MEAEYDPDKRWVEVIRVGGTERGYIPAKSSKGDPRLEALPVAEMEDEEDEVVSSAKEEDDGEEGAMGIDLTEPRLPANEVLDTPAANVMAVEGALAHPAEAYPTATAPATEGEGEGEGEAN